MSGFNSRVQKVPTLDDLCSVLNSFVQLDSCLPLEHEVDLTDLPTFSINGPTKSCEAFSWDVTRVLVDNSGVLEGDNWELVERCSVCGEPFCCDHQD